MAYFRTKQWGERQSILGTTGLGTAPSMPNTGVSIVTATSAEAYVLQPPVAGCEKTIAFHTYSTTALPVVKLCTDGAAVTVSFVGSSTNLSIMKSAAGKSTVCATVVTLKGFNSTSWLITNVWPNMGSVTTGSTSVNTGITLSST